MENYLSSFKLRSENFICAVIDVQGFYIDRKFYPRELAIVNDKLRLCFEIDCEFPPNMNMEYNVLKKFTFQQIHLHGIPMKKVLNDKTSRCFKNKDLKNLVQELYNRVKTEDKFIFATKNQQTSDLLWEYEIPYLDLEKQMVGNEICPTLKDFDKVVGPNNCFCLLHFVLNKPLYNSQFRCALRKSIYIWDWLKYKVESDRFVNDIISSLD